MTDDEITEAVQLAAAANERAAKATPGPWIGNGYGPSDPWVRISQNGEPGDPICDVGYNQYRRKEDTEFIAASRSDVPALSAAVLALAAALREARKPTPSPNMVTEYDGSDYG